MHKASSEIYSLSALDREIYQAAKKLWGIEQLSSRFIPLLQSSWGDAGSPIALEIAAKTKQAPGQLADALCAELEKRAGVVLTRQADFVNARFDNSLEFLFGEEQEPPVQSESFHLVIVASGASSALALYRIVALAVFQALALRDLGHRVILEVLGDLPMEITPDISAQRVWAETGAIAKKRARPDQSIELSRSGLKASLSSRLAQINIPRTIVWLSGSALDRRELTAVNEMLAARTALFNLRCVDSRWLGLHSLSATEEQAWRVTLDQFPLSTLWYLTSPLMGEDLDPAVPRLAESANLIWFVSALGSRLELIAARALGKQQVQADLPPLENFRELLVQRRFLPLFFVRAAESGEVREYTEVLSLLLRSAMAWCNSPEIQAIAANGGLTDFQEKLVTGVAQALSGSINRSSVLRGALAERENSTPVRRAKLVES